MFSAGPGRQPRDASSSSESRDEETKKKHLEGFTYNPITARKQCLVQRSTPTAPQSGSQLAGMMASSYGTRPADTVDAKELDAMMKKVGDMENERKDQQDTLNNCNEKLSDVLDKVSFRILMDTFLMNFNFMSASCRET